MNKKLYKYFSAFCQLDSNNSAPVETIDEVRDESLIMSVLNEIFSVDERTGFPKGDIAYYMSPNGNPQVKEWLVNNLMSPRFGVKEHNDAITDDMLVEFSRQSGESVDAYATRLNGIKSEALETYRKAINSNKD